LDAIQTGHPPQSRVRSRLIIQNAEKGFKVAKGPADQNLVKIHETTITTTRQGIPQNLKFMNDQIKFLLKLTLNEAHLKDLAIALNKMSIL
jgi:hypothetical protein